MWRGFVLLISLIATVTSHTFKNIYWVYAFVPFLWCSFLSISIILAHFAPSVYKRQVFLTFSLCTGTEHREEPKSIFEKYAPQPYSSIFAFPESFFHFGIEVNTGILTCSPAHAASTLSSPKHFFPVNVIDSPLVGSISSLQMLLFCTSRLRYCFFICIYSC